MLTKNGRLAFLAAVTAVLVAVLAFVYFPNGSERALSQTPVGFDAFRTLDTQGLASLQIKLTWVSAQDEPVYTVAFAAEGHTLDMSEFVPYRRPAFSYSNDGLIVDGQAVLLTFSASTSEMQAIVDGIGYVPGATDGLDPSDPRVSLMLQAVPASGDIGFEDVLDACDSWRVLTWTQRRLDPANTEGLDVVDTALSLYTGFDADIDGVNDDCDPCADTPDCDGDDFRDYVELMIGTDPEDDCTDNLGVHDAWPLDINIDTWVTVGGDVLPYRGRIGATGGPPPDANWWQRLDLNMDNWITVGGDVLPFRGMIGAQCPLP